jgi:hypothetical protein
LWLVGAGAHLLAAVVAAAAEAARCSR